MSSRKITVALIAGGQFHDIDFARLELLKLLAEDERARVRVFEDFSNIAAICAADFLVSYTCNVVPSLPAQEALRAYLERGGRWFALHGTNSILRFLADGKVDAPPLAPHFMATLGSMFIAHPPIGPYRVTVVDPSHPLTRDLEPFETTDELYLLDTYGALQVLLETEFEGEAPSFVRRQWRRARHPVFYLNHHGSGAVLYLTLGHCRGHYDLEPLKSYWPQVDRCSWNLPVYYELLRRGIAWAKDCVTSPSTTEEFTP